MSAKASRPFNGAYTGSNLDRVAFPLGGFGAGMICLEGAGGLSHVSIRGHAEVFNEPFVFAAIAMKGKDGHTARVLEGAVPTWKLFFPWGKQFSSAGNGGPGKTYGLPRFADASFLARFPFGTVSLADPAVPLTVTITGWSPFTPGNADDSSLPVAGLEYTFTNRSADRIESVFSFHARNFTRDLSLDKLPKEKRPAHGIRKAEDGFAMFQDGCAEQPWSAASFIVATDASSAVVNCRWFRGGWFDANTLVWKSVADMALPAADAYTEGGASEGGSLYVPLALSPGESQTIRLRFSWYAPQSNIRAGKGVDDLSTDSAKDCGCGPEGCAPPAQQKYRPWYAGKFSLVDEVASYWRSNYARLRQTSQVFADCFYDTTLPAEVIEAVAANLSILKSPTVNRQTDGRAWLWEGCFDDAGCCHGSCTHVWNYAQAMAHLFPDLERSLRATEFHEDQDEKGHQAFRAPLPIRPVVHDFHPAADGQLGGIMKVYREWKISGDTAWLRRFWPRVKQSLDYCIATWDPDHEGLLKEPHHNTYDIEFWGPDGMCGSFYAGALKAACLMGAALGEPTPAYDELFSKAKHALEDDLYDGEYFIQHIRWKDLRAESPVTARTHLNTNYSAEARALLELEGPKYQYGKGCLSDGVLGAWIAESCGVGEILDAGKVRSHLLAVHKYNFRSDLSTHANVQRPTYAVGNEAGLLLCSWPKGGALTLPFVYCDEVWTGIEYQVASHLMMMGCVEPALEIVRAVRNRYDGQVRNPFNEYECGHWYGRALASYGLLQGMTGQSYDAVRRTLTLKPQMQGDWRAFLCTATGFGTVGMRNGRPFLDIKHGDIPLDRIEVRA
jgi:uncharacterized protein (DUF608 family)